MSKQDELEMLEKNMLTLEGHDPIQTGFWVPNRLWGTVQFLAPLREMIKAKREAGTLKPMTPVMVAFKEWVNTHATYRMWVNSMIEQANAFVASTSKRTRKKISKDGDAVWIEDFDSLCETINEIITTSPQFNNTVQVGTPLNGLLAVGMGTEAGAALFHDATFNAEFKKVLDAWNTFLKSPFSLDLLDIEDPEKTGSWISTQAHQAGVWKDMVHNRHLPAYGYDSWNSFFIREFVPGARPFQGNPKTQIDIGCETTPWDYRKDLKFETPFWLKTIDYSLLDIFAGHRDLAELFRGGQAYQGFLSATHYHRWNAPLDGEIVRSWVEPGTYFAQRPGQGEDRGTWEGTQSQPYLPQVATRAIFIFKHPAAGFVALICVGMVEVSTCVIRPGFAIPEGGAPLPITRGTEIGHFEFGGSTHMMIFQKDKVVLEKWAINAKKHRHDKHPTPMGTIIATATNT